MKQIKLMLMAMMVALMGMTVTSCLDSDNESAYDFEGVAVLMSDSYITTSYKMGHLTLTIANSSSYFTDSKAPEVGYFYVKLVEGEVYSNEKSEYNVNLIGGASITINELCNETDSLMEESTSFSQIKEPWVVTSYAKYTDYLSITFTTPVINNKTKMEMFNLYPSDVDEEGKLVFTLHHQEEVNYGAENKEVSAFFRAPDWYELQNGKSKDENSQWIAAEKLEDLKFNATGDSVSFVIKGKGYGDTLIESKAGKMKLRKY